MNQGPKWLKKLNAPCDASLGLFCFPCAGAGASMFRNWPRRLPAGTEVWAAQLPGRDSRFLEAPVKQMASMVACITAELLLLPETPYVLCGHSMGALIAFETARLIRKRGKSLPEGSLYPGTGRRECR